MQATKSKKDNKKITFKTKLTLSTLAAAAVTGGTMAVTGNVHADTVNTQAGTQTQMQDSQASDLKTQQDASRQAYADANKANADAHQATQNAQDNLVHATAKNTEAQGTVDNAQSAVNQASDDVTAATNKANQAQTDVENAQDAQTQAQNDYDNAVKQSTTSADEQAALDQAQAAAKTAEGDVTDAQSQLANATSKQSQAQSNADTATQNVKDATDRVNSDQSAVNQAENSVKNAENDVQTAQNHDQVVAQDQSNVQAKTDAKQAADAKVNDAQKINDEKNEAQSNAQTAVNDAQKTVDQLSKDASAQPVKESITVSPEWINLVKSIQNRFNSTKYGVMDFTDEEGQQYVKLSNEIAKNAHYINDPTQAAIPVHINNDGTLSKEDQIDATRFFLSLINPIRKAAGMPELHMTDQSLQVGTAVADAYNASDWNVFPYKINSLGITQFDNANPHFGLHNYHAISDSGAGNEALTGGIHTVVYNTPGDELSGAKAIEYPKNWATNRDQLHEQLYKDVIGFLFQDGSNPGHAKILLGMHTNMEKVTGTNNASVQFDKYNQLHFNVEDKADTSTEIPVETSSQTDDHAAQLASAKQTLQDAQTKLATATSEASQASADLANAKADAQHAADELKVAQDKLAHDSNSSMSPADAQAALKNAKVVLAQKQANLADAKKNLQNANTMKSQSDSALEKANADVKAAQDAVQTAQAKAKDANAKVDAIKTEIAKNNKAASDAETKLNQAKEALQVAQSKKDDADKALANAKAKLANKQDALKKAQADAQTAAQNLKNAQNAVKKAQAHEQDTQAALAKAKDNLITDNKVYGDSVAIKDQTIHAGEINKIVDPEIANPMAADPTQNLVMGAFLQMAASKLDTIPTGTTASWGDLNTLNHDANTVGDHSEDVLVTFPDGSTTTVKMNLHVLAAVKPSQPDTPVVNPGHDQLDKAKANFQAKKNAYDDAVAHLISDAQQYGSQVKLAQDHFTINEGDQLPTLKLDNQFAPHRENSAITNMFMNLAAMPGDVLPEGTKISWADPTKAQNDAQHAGDYTENVLITFPDGSTITKQVELTVKYNPSLHQTQTDITNVPGLPAGTHVINGQVVNANGQIMPEYQVINGQIVKTTTATQLTKASNAISSENTTLKRSDLNNGKLPQTGNSLNEAGLIGLGVLGMLTMLGLANNYRRKN